jgi:hypothetical protein
VRDRGGLVVHNRGLGSEQGGTGWCGGPDGSSLQTVGAVEFIRRRNDVFR